MVDRVFEDGPSVFPEDTAVDEDIKSSLMNDMMLCFPMLANMEKYSNELDELHVVEKDSNKCKMRDSKGDDKRPEMMDEEVSSVMNCSSEINVLVSNLFSCR